MFRMRREQRFDFDMFFALALEGTRAAFTSIRRAHPDETIYGYGLSSHDDATSLNASANSEEALLKKLAKVSPDEFERNPTQREYYRLCMNEWVYSESSDALDAANSLIYGWGEESDFGHGDAFLAHKNRVFDTSIRVLEALIEEGFFGTAEEREQLFIHFSLPDTFQTEVMIESARRLNTPAVFARHMAANLY